MKPLSDGNSPRPEGDVSIATPPSFLDTIPEPAVGNIFRQLSARPVGVPFGDLWPSWVPFEDVKKVSRNQRMVGGMPPVSEESVRRQGPWTPLHTPVPKCRLRQVIMAGNRRIESVSLIEGSFDSEDLKHLPEHLRSLSLALDSNGIDLTTISTNCSELRVLELHSDIDLDATRMVDWLAALGPGLESLSVINAVSDDLVVEDTLSKSLLSFSEHVRRQSKRRPCRSAVVVLNPTERNRC